MTLSDRRDDIPGFRRLPSELPDPIQATWSSALRELEESSSSVEGKERYQFCCGYLQALQDSGVIDPRVCRLLEDMIQELWADTLNELNQRGI